VLVSDAVMKVVNENAFEIISPDYNLELVVIIVKRRGSTRFFSVEEDRSGNKSFLKSNPGPGTVCDDTVVKADLQAHEKEFFLISQNVRQGSVTPTRYHVLHNSRGIKAETIQHITFSLTHLYFNWAGTIAVPAPLQYAAKCAFLATQSLHTFHHAALSNNLYFL